MPVEFPPVFLCPDTLPLLVPILPGVTCLFSAAGLVVQFEAKLNCVDCEDCEIFIGTASQHPIPAAGGDTL